MSSTQQRPKLSNNAKRSVLKEKSIRKGVKASSRSSSAKKIPLKSRDDRRNSYRLLQLFPNMHPVAIEEMHEACNRSFLRTVDNLIYVQRYLCFLRVMKSDPSGRFGIQTPPTSTRLPLGIVPNHRTTALFENSVLDSIATSTSSSAEETYLPSGIVDESNLIDVTSIQTPTNFISHSTNLYSSSPSCEQ